MLGDLCVFWKKCNTSYDCVWGMISFRLTTLTYTWKQEQPRKQSDHRLKPQEPSVIELSLARLVNKQSVVLDLPRVAIPGEVLATETVPVEIVSFIMLFYPVGRTKALVFFQKSWTSSKSCDVAVNTLSRFISGLQSGNVTSRDQSPLRCVGKTTKIKGRTWTSASSISKGCPYSTGQRFGLRWGQATYHTGK